MKNNNIKNRGNGVLALMAFMLFFATTFPAFAQTSSTTTTIGGMIISVGKDLWTPISTLLVAGSYLVGFFFIGSALFRLIEAGGRGGEGGYKDALARLFGGAILVTLPDVLHSGLITIFNSAFKYTSDTGVTAGTVTQCVMSTTSSSGSTGTGASSASCVIQNFANDIVPSFLPVAFGFMFLWGAYLVATAVHAVASSHVNGGNRSQVKWLPRSIIGLLMCNFSTLFNGIAQTMGYSSSTITSSGFSAVGSTLLSYTPPASLGISSDYASMIGNIFAIMIVFGVIACARGLSHLKAHAEGSQQGTFGSGVTHIIGGVMLANAKMSICLVVSTLFGSASGFC
jgi:hypothetical protein